MLAANRPPLLPQQFSRPGSRSVAELGEVAGEKMQLVGSNAPARADHDAPK